MSLLTRELAIIFAGAFLTACASKQTPPPVIDLDEPVVQAIPQVEPVKPVQLVEVPTPLPLPGQLKPLDQKLAAHAEMRSPQARIAQANESARIQPTQEGYVNAIQVWPYSAGALYQVYASPGKVTDVALQEGEELVSVSAGDTVRWVIGDTVSGAGPTQRVHLLVKPTRADLATNVVVMTTRRAYYMELTSTERTWMASVSWQYPHDSIAQLRARERKADAVTSIAEGIALERLRFRYEITGDTPPWRPVRAFDDGEKVYIQFPAGIAQGELPPLFIVGPMGDNQLVNYRVRTPYYIVDRLFGAAELRLGAEPQQAVRISRTDGRVARNPG